MKRTFRIIVPILLVIAILACMIWYLFVYDRDFARDLLLSQARYFEEHGQNELSVWLYDLAYAHSDNDASVAIELAEHYKASGNFTKAEYTLSRAISNGGTTELYIALCKTYVEQDKLLDAVAMLDSIPDASIKAQLDALRPAAPVVNYTPGFYSQYISVSITAESGTLYVNTTGEYPSIENAPHSGAITLGQGETNIYAITVGENGLVSTLGRFGYTVGGVIEEVVFADAAMEAHIRSLLGADAGQVLFTNDLWTITEMVIPESVQVYDDLAKLPYLTSLTVYNAKSDELDSIGYLTQLQSLIITGCSPSSATMSAIASLPNLTELTLAQCGLTDISVLAALRNLQYLDLSYNSIRDISALRSMDALQTLFMSHNALEDLNALSSLSNLRTLNVSYNSITSLAPICSIVSLRSLDISNNMLSNLGAVNNLSALTYLNAGYNDLTDITVLSGCTALTELNLSNNVLTDLSPLAGLTGIERLDFSYNQVTDLPDWSTNCNLVIINGSYNQLTDLEELQQMPYLNKVFMDYNPELTSVESLTYCPNLIQVDIFGTKVIDVSFLTEQSIIVHYDPTNVDIGGETLPEETTPEDSQPEETE